MRTISLDKLPLLYAAMAEAGPLYLPLADDDGRVDFGPWRDGARVNLDVQTTKSGKDFFFPQTENIVSFETKGKQISVRQSESPDAPFIVFGMRGWDVAGMKILDSVFLSDPRDSFYEARRKAGTIVAIAPSHPEESSFSTTFGIDPANPDGDVAVWIVDGVLYWRPRSDKGEALTARLGALLEDAGEAGDKAVAAEQARIAERLRDTPFYGLELPKVSPEELLAYFDAPVWAALAESCLGCGTCTFVCPTCQCYDIQDRETGDGQVRRFRCWDSCMYSDFTLMAHGNNRTTQLQRFRQRFMHKLVYFPQNNGGVYGCVGCGRCVERCPMGLNIVKIIKAMNNMEVKADV